MQKSNFSAHAAIIIANVIFGLGVPVTKFLLEGWVTPHVYMASRCIGAALLFWAVAAFLPRERISGRDLAVIIGGGLLGFFISQTLTAWALNYTSPVYFSLIATLTPIAVMLLAALFIGERITPQKLLGVVLGIAGAALMVVLKWQSQGGSNDLLGIILALLSLLTWAVYLIITRHVSARYSSVSQMKWMFLVSTIAILPLAWTEFPMTRLYGETMGWESSGGWIAMLFIVLFATGIGYFLIPVAMKQLRATTVSVYTNLQPIVASVVAITVGQDVLTWDKPVAAVLVLLGAWLVSKEK
jgi:drug/metabolite transporter (DMT)-like permease